MHHPNGHWQKWENVEAVLRQLMAENHGLIPSRSAFIAAGYAGMLQTISQKYGGLNAVRTKMNVEGQKVCKACWEVKVLSDFRVKSKNNTDSPHRYRDNICRQCSSDHVDDYRRTWPGRAAELVSSAKERAVKHKLPHTITKAWLLARLHMNGLKCELTGIPFSYEKVGGYFSPPFAASLDRINAREGYTEDNTRVVCLHINRALGPHGDEFFETVAIAFLQRRGFSVSSLSAQSAP